MRRWPTPAGRIAAEYDDPVVLLLMTVWAISRGSDAVSGELNRGTMEMLLGQPVTRLGVISVQACVTLLGAALIAMAAWLGTCVGLATVSLDGSAGRQDVHSSGDQPVRARRRFWPG